MLLVSKVIQGLEEKIMACKVVVTGQNEGKKAHRSDIGLQGKVSFCNQKRAYPIRIQT
jgi:hypothetical protein